MLMNSVSPYSFSNYSSLKLLKVSEPTKRQKVSGTVSGKLVHTISANLVKQRYVYAILFKDQAFSLSAGSHSLWGLLPHPLPPFSFSVSLLLNLVQHLLSSI